MSPAITREEAFDRTMRCNAGHEYRLGSWDCPDPAHKADRVEKLEADLRLLRGDMGRLLTTIQTAEAAERERSQRIRALLDRIGGGGGSDRCLRCGIDIWYLRDHDGERFTVNEELEIHEAGFPTCERQPV